MNEKSHWRLWDCRGEPLSPPERLRENWVSRYSSTGSSVSNGWKVTARAANSFASVLLANTTFAASAASRSEWPSPAKMLR